MTLPAAISLATVLLALFLAISNFSAFLIRGAPREQRWFALMALSTCFYSGPNGLLTLPVSDAAILACSRVSIAAAALHVVTWVHYGQRNGEQLSRTLTTWLDASLLASGAMFSIAGLTGRVVARASVLPGAVYRVAETTAFGGITFALLMSGLVLLMARHARAAARRVRYARSHLAALAVLLAGAANDSAVTLGWSRLPYLLDGAFFIAVAILGVVMTRRWADDLRALDRALESRDEFIAIASHELKTPLTPLTLQVQLVRRKLAAEESVQGDWLDQQLKMLARQVDRLGRLVNELLEFSRFERGRLRLELEEVDLATVVREAVAQLQETSAARGASEIRLQIDEPARGRWDPLRLSQIVVNLVDNAIKYGEGKPIDLVVQSSAQATIISVSDRGIGISAEHQARIFDKFERAVPARQYGGLGLGLYITRQIVEALGGSIRVTSRPGGGTTFTVTLPDGDGARRPG